MRLQFKLMAAKLKRLFKPSLAQTLEILRIRDKIAAQKQYRALVKEQRNKLARVLLEIGELLTSSPRSIKEIPNLYDQ